MSKVLVVDYERCTGCRLCEMVCSVIDMSVVEVVKDGGGDFILTAEPRDGTPVYQVDENNKTVFDEFEKAIYGLDSEKDLITIERALLAARQAASTSSRVASGRAYSRLAPTVS